METCKNCGSESLVSTEYGSTVCGRCGVEDFNTCMCTMHASNGFAVPLIAPATYTRVKRFRKYLQRAAMNQSASTIPADTWDYLLQGLPYRGPRHIVRRLKKAPKNIRKKCYDSLPLLVKELCPHVNVPMLTEYDKVRAMVAFRTLDAAYNEGEPFVSYLYALEYILKWIGRDDVLPFINKISCRKRRYAYSCRLNRIFTQ